MHCPCSNQSPEKDKSLCLSLCVPPPLAGDCGLPLSSVPACAALVLTVGFAESVWEAGVRGGRFLSCSDAGPLGPALQMSLWQQSAQVSSGQLQDIQLFPWGVLLGCRVPSRRAQLSHSIP